MSARQSTLTNRVCKQCSRGFYCRPVLIRRGGGIYCSRACLGMSKRVGSLRAAFFRHITEPSPSGCIHWTGFQNEHGYGKLVFGKKTLFAHRVAWEIAFGPVPDDQCVLHTCDNRLCVTPGHLWLGDRADNQADMTAKRRNYMLITDAQVRELRGLFAEGHTRKALAVRFGICISQVGAILRGESRRLA